MYNCSLPDPVTQVYGAECAPFNLSEWSKTLQDVVRQRINLPHHIRLLSIAYSTATMQYTASLSDFYQVNGVFGVLSFKLPLRMPSRLKFPMHPFFRHTKAPLVRLNSPSGIPAKMFMGSVTMRTTY